MRKSILPLVACALVLPSCTLLFNQERRWTDAGGLDAAVDAPPPDAVALPDAFVPVDAPRQAPSMPNLTAQSVSLTCPGEGLVRYQDPADGTRNIAVLNAGLAAFPRWLSFAMLGNNVEITSAASDAIPSHAIWLVPGPIPHISWLERVGDTGTYRIPWDIDEVEMGRAYTPGAGTPFVVATANRFIAGGGDTLVNCPNTRDVVVGVDDCAVVAPVGTGPVWGGFGPGNRAIVAQQVGSSVSFPDFMDGEDFPSSGMLRQPTGSLSSALYSENTLFIVSTGEPYTVTPIALPTPRNTRVSFDGTSYQHATITPASAFDIVVSSCAGDSCSGGATTRVNLPDEALVDWTFHALSGGVRVAVLLTRDSAAPIALGTHVSVAMWHAGDVAPVIPLRIASGRVDGFSGHGQGRSIQSVAELSADGSQLDVYVSALVTYFLDSTMPITSQDRIYLSGFRLCL